jgi:hypothetical protein
MDRLLMHCRDAIKKPVQNVTVKAQFPALLIIQINPFEEQKGKMVFYYLYLISKGCSKNESGGRKNEEIKIRKVEMGE